MSSNHHLIITSACLLGLIVSACKGSPAAAALGPGDASATVHSQNAATYSVQWTAIAATSTAAPSDTPNPAAPPTVTPQPTPTALPGSIPVSYAYGAVPQAAVMRLGIGAVHSSALSPDRRWFAVGADSGIYVFDTDHMAQVWGQATHSAVEQVVWSTDSATVMARLFEWSNVLAWKAETGDLVYRLENSSDVAAMAVSPDGGKLAVGLGTFSSLTYHDSINAVAIWDLATGSRDIIWAETDAGKPFDVPVSALDWSPDGAKLAAITGFGTTTVFDMAARKPLYILDEPVPSASLVSAAVFSPDGAKLVTYTGITEPLDIPGGDKHAYVWDMASGKLLFTPLNDGPVIRGLWSPDGSALVTEGETGRYDSQAEEYVPVHDLKIWDTASGRLIQSPDYGPHYTWSRDGQSLVFAQPGASSADWLDINTGKSETRPVEAAYGANPVGVSWVPDGLLETSALTGAPIGLLKTGRVAFGGAWSPDGSQFATIPPEGSADPLTIWDAITGLQLRTVDPAAPLPFWLHVRQVDHNAGECSGRQPAPDPAGKNRIDITADPYNSDPSVPVKSTITVTDIATGRKRFALIEQHSIICATAFSPDGRYLAIGHMPHDRGAWAIQNTSTDDNFVTVWDLKDGSPVNKYVGHTGSVAQLVWSPDERKLASISWDGTVIIWAVPI